MTDQIKYLLVPLALSLMAGCGVNRPGFSGDLFS